MRKAYRLAASVAILMAIASAFGETTTRLTAFPSMNVADGRSTCTITAEVRDQSGKLVPDGTRIVFNTTAGEFRQNITTTTAGLAQAVLVAPPKSSPETITATITVTALTGDSSPSTMSYDFVATREDLTSAKEYIEIVAPGYMQYSAVDPKTIAAAGPHQGVSLRYKEISVTADDIQLTISTYELRARNVTLKTAKFTQHFDELYFNLKSKAGSGTTTFMMKRPDAIVTQGVGIAFVKQIKPGVYALPPDEERYGYVKVTASSITPSDQAAPALDFQFMDLSGAPSAVSAKKAIIFPNRKIQFQGAEVYVAGTKVMKMPLFELDLNTPSPVVTDQIVGVNDNQLAINYPYYLSLKPGQSSDFRFRTGEAYGRGVTSDHGAFLDYEVNWNKGDDMQGGFVFSGIGRDDWSVGANQYIRIGDRTSLSAQVTTPTGQSVFGSASASRQFTGFSTSLSANLSKNFTGIPYTTQTLAAEVDKDPIKVAKTPIRIDYGFTASQASNSLINESQEGAGAKVRAQSLPVKLDNNTNVTSSFTTSYLVGQNELKSLQYLATTTLSHRFNSAMSMQCTYNFTRDGFNENFIGEHQLTMQAYYNKGQLNLTVLANKSLDLANRSVYGDLSFRVSKLWRLMAGYTYDQYLGDTYLDYTFGFGYKVGWKEVGLVWSEQTRRIGLQLLGATIY